MAVLARLVLAWAVVAQIARGCAETGTCDPEVLAEEIHEVSLLQTELHVKKSPAKLASINMHESSVAADDQRPSPSTSGSSAVAPARGWWAQESARMQEADEKIALSSKQASVRKGKDSGKVTMALALTWCSVIIALLGLAGIVHFITEKEPADRCKYVAEFVGTFMLVFSVGCNVLVGDETWGVTSIACTLMVMIYALGGVSGANFNPAVSVALGLSQKLPWDDVAIYVCVQLAAGIAAGLGYGFLLGETFNLAPKGAHDWVDVALAEFFYTFMLCFVVLNTAASKRHGGQNQFYGLAIGFSVVAGGYGAGSISGGCFNPAVALGIDAPSYDSGFGWCFPYFAFEIVGCVVAAVLFRVCRPEDFEASSDAESVPKYSLGSKLVCEFLGTFMLVLTVGLNVLSESKAGAFSIAASLMCMIFALGSNSGAHFNPAVTTAIVCAGRGAISSMEAALYMCVQILGGILAGFTYMLMMDGKTVALKPKVSTAEALVGEFIFTFLLCFVVLAVATTKQPLSEYFGLAIGACVIAGGYAIGGLSGGSLNPAVSAGLALSDAFNGGPLEHLGSYASVELLGGVLAAGIFGLTHVSEYASVDKVQD
jgi:aquaporin Z